MLTTGSGSGYVIKKEMQGGKEKGILEKDDWGPHFSNGRHPLILDWAGSSAAQPSRFFPITLDNGLSVIYRGIQLQNSGV